MSKREGVFIASSRCLVLSASETMSHERGHGQSSHLISLSFLQTKLWTIPEKGVVTARCFCLVSRLNYGSLLRGDYLPNSFVLSAGSTVNHERQGCGLAGKLWIITERGLSYFIPLSCLRVQLWITRGRDGPLSVIPLLGHTKILHAPVAMDSAALAAAVGLPS